MTMPELLLEAVEQRLLRPLDAQFAMIREGKSYHITSVMQTRPEAGMQTIEMSLSQLVTDKKISMQGRIINDPKVKRNEAIDKELDLITAAL